MKKFLVVMLAFLVSSNLMLAQKNKGGGFEGSISYELTYMGEMADQLAGMLPNKKIVKFLGTDMLTRQEGGLMGSMMGEILVKGNEKTAYMVKASEQTAYKMGSQDETTTEEKPDMKVTKEDEVIKILGYDCQKYKIETTTEGGTIVMYQWVTPSIKPSVPKDAANGGSNMIVSDQIDGFPLKTMTSIDMGGMKMNVIEVATEVKKEKLDASMFSIPSNYTIKDFDPNMFNGMGQ